MENDAILVFTRFGMGEAPLDLQQDLTVKFLSLLAHNESLPAKIIFYTDGVKLACQGSPALEALIELEKCGVELILCQTCLTYYQLLDQVKLGIVGGMPDIIEAMHKANKVIHL